MVCGTVDGALSELLLFTLPERHPGQKSREAVGQMAPAMPTSRVQHNAGQALVGPAIVLTGPVSTGDVARHETEIVTGRELRLVPSSSAGEGVLFERVTVGAHPSVVHLDVAWEAPLIVGAPVLVSPRRPAAGRLTCGCWQSLRLLGSTRRHDHDHLTGSCAGVSCPACGRGQRPGLRL